MKLGGNALEERGAIKISMIPGINTFPITIGKREERHPKRGDYDITYSE